MRTSRNLLHKCKADEFREWLRSLGWVDMETKGDFEVFRMAKAGEGPLIVHSTANAKEHYTTSGLATSLALAWLRGKAKARKQNRHEKKAS